MVTHDLFAAVVCVPATAGHGGAGANSKTRLRSGGNPYLFAALGGAGAKSVAGAMLEDSFDSQSLAISLTRCA